MTTLRTVHELQQHNGQSTRDQGTHLGQVTIAFKFQISKNMSLVQVLWHPPTCHPPYGGLEEKRSRGGLGSTCRRTQSRWLLPKLAWSQLYFSDGDRGCPGASSEIPNWASHIPGELSKSQKVLKRFYPGTSGIEAASNPGAKGKRGSDCETAGREIQRDDEKPCKSGWE